MQTKNFKLSTVAIAVSLVLTACGGGGGGGGYVNTGSGSSGSSGSGSGYSTTVPYYTPVKVDTVTPLVTNTYNYAISTPYSVDLTNSGKDNLIIASTESSGGTAATDWKNSRIFIYGWDSNKSLVNQTSQWFSNNDNIIAGTNMIKFGDMTGNGNQGIFVAPYTDGNKAVNQMQVFVNEGSRFTRYNIDLPYNISSHDSTMFRWNGVDNAVALDYGTNTTFVFGSNTRNFQAYSVNSWTGSGSAIASGDFLNNGSTTFIIGDTGFSKYSTRLINWNFNGTGVSLTDIGTLPLPRFELSKYDGLLTAPIGQNRSHTVRVLPMDFDNSGVTSAVLISRPSNPVSGIGSEVQFLKNNGAGVFTDVTDSVLVNYDIKANASYTPAIMDINKDGLKDIVLPGGGIGDPQVLIHTKEGKYVSSYATVLTDFQNQVKQIQGTNLGSRYEGTESNIMFVRGPDNDLYLLNLVSVDEITLQRKVIYLSKVGSLNGSSAEATITSIKQAWPYMSDAQVNMVLASTGKTWFGGSIIIDETALWTPYGQIGLDTMSGMKNITGHISGVKIGNGDTGMIALDGLNRTWKVDLAPSVINHGFNAFGRNSEHVDQFDLSSHSEYLINANMNTVGPLRMGYEERNQWNTLNYNDPSTGPVIGAWPRNYSIGMPKIWNGGSWTFGAQYTTLGYNPWLGISGSWGMVTGSSILDYVLSYRYKEWSAKMGIMQTSTQFNPGLVTKITPITGTWAETGYRYNNIGIYAGIKPTAISGAVEANLPTGIDPQGRIIYSRRKFDLNNEMTTYIRGLVQVNLSRDYTVKFGGTIMSNGEYRVMNELRYQF